MTNSAQLENGYTRIANEVLEVIYGTNFNATQLKIILCVIRYTYGFNRKSHTLSVNFISKATGVSKRYISNELQKLIKANVILVIKNYTVTNSRELQLNKNHQEWIGYRMVVRGMKDCSPDEEQFNTTGEGLFSTTGEELFYQEKQIKENIKESKANSFSVKATTKKTNDNYEDFFEEVWKLYPNKKGKSAVSKKSKKAIYELGKDGMVKAINNYKKDLESNPWKDPMYGSTFFNGRYEDYLDESNSGLAEDTENQVVPTGKIRIMTDEDIERYNEQRVVIK